MVKKMYNKKILTEEKWLAQINETDRLDEYLQAIIGPLLKVAAAIGRAAVVTGRAAAKAGAKGAKVAGKAAVKGARAIGKGIKKVGKKIGKKAKEKIAQKASDIVRDKAMDKIDKATKGSLKIWKVKSGDDEEDVGDKIKAAGGKSVLHNESKILEFRQALRRRMLKEVLAELRLKEDEPSAEQPGDKKGMNPEDAKEILKNIGDKTVKASKSGKEIKVTSALQTHYKEKDPSAHKKAKSMFQKAAKDYYGAKQKEKGQKPTEKPTEKPKPKKDQKPDVNDAPEVKSPKDMNPQELSQDFQTKKEKESKAAQKLNILLLIILKRDPDSPKAKKALQAAADEHFSARVEKSNSVVDMVDHYKSKEAEVKAEHPNPLSSERRAKLKQLRDEKKKAFNDTGMTSSQMADIQNQKRIKDKWDGALDPAGESNVGTEYELDGKQVEVASTRIDPDTGKVKISTYELDGDGNKKLDKDGNYTETEHDPEEFENNALTPEQQEKRAATKQAWQDWFNGQFDFSDPVNFDLLEPATSGFVAA